MRVLITGAAGFVGRHLAAACRRQQAEVFGLTRSRALSSEDFSRTLVVDLTDPNASRAAVRAVRPERVFHLAADASVAASWADPAHTVENNVRSALNLLEAVRAEAPDAAVLLAGSGEEYGPVPADRLPVTEDEPPRPQNPYAVGKAAVTLMGGFFADAYGLRVARMRAFNHAGPGQSDAYVVSSFARQIAEAERTKGRGDAPLETVTGDPRPRRDFTDVRDVVRAYWAALDGPGDLLNVCSGRSVAVQDILDGLARLTPLTVERRTDPERLRPNEVMEIRGSRERLRSTTGWEPEIPFDRTLRDTLDWWRQRAAVPT